MRLRSGKPDNGTWQLRAFTGSDPLTGKPRQIAQTFRGSEAAARKALAKLVAKAEDGKVAKTDATVGQLLDKWLETAPTRGRGQRPRTLYENKSKIDNRIVPVLGHVKLARLGADTLDAAYQQWVEEGLSPTTVHKLHSILSAACRQAVKWGWIEEAPTERATPPAPTKKPIVVPTFEQLRTLITEAEAGDPVLATFIALAALTGARRGELCGLRWSDVDLELGLIRIARSLTVAGGRIHEGPTKTHLTRTIALRDEEGDVGVEVLRRRWQDAQELAQEADSPLVDDPYVLSYNANGARPVNPDTFTHRFSAVCRSLERKAAKRRMVKVEELPGRERWPFHVHSLRHFSATTLIADGVDIRTVSNRLGHAQTSTTLNIYAHPISERDRAAAGVLGRALTAGK